MYDLVFCIMTHSAEVCMPLSPVIPIFSCVKHRMPKMHRLRVFDLFFSRKQHLFNPFNTVYLISGCPILSLIRDCVTRNYIEMNEEFLRVLLNKPLESSCFSQLLRIYPSLFFQISPLIFYCYEISTLLFKLHSIKQVSSDFHSLSDCTRDHKFEVFNKRCLLDIFSQKTFKVVK